VSREFFRVVVQVLDHQNALPHLGLHREVKQYHAYEPSQEDKVGASSEFIVRREELDSDEECDETLKEVDNEAAAIVLMDSCAMNVKFFLVHSQVSQEGHRIVAFIKLEGLICALEDINELWLRLSMDFVLSRNRTVIYHILEACIIICVSLPEVFDLTHLSASPEPK